MIDNCPLVQGVVRGQLSEKEWSDRARSEKKREEQPWKKIAK